MTGGTGVLAVIPARSGSKGLPGKNVRPLAGLPLIAHSILFAKLCPEIDRVIVSTDSEAVADVARQFGADVPFLRPAALAADETPLWPVLRHALQTAEQLDGRRYDYLVLLDPTSPFRLPEDLTGAYQRLRLTPDADGTVSVSRPDFNPIWHCVIEEDGWLRDLIPQGAAYERRQDVPVVYRINGSLYIWRTEFVRREGASWRSGGKHLLYETPERRSASIDDLDEFVRAELVVTSGMVALPWLKDGALS